MLVSAVGVKKPNTTSSGAVIEVTVGNCTSPILADLATRHKKVFLPRLAYNRKTLATYKSFTISAHYETFNEVCHRQSYPVVMRPFFRERC